MTTLDMGNATRIIDGISFESRTDWIVGETTSNNHVTLTEGDSGEVLESGAGIYIGANAGSNENSLTIQGTLSATEVVVGAEGNFGNALFLDATATNMINSITLFELNSLLIEGEFTTFGLMDSALSTTNLFVALDGNTELITEANFESLILTDFDSGSGYTSFTAISAVPEPSSAALLLATVAGIALRRRRNPLR